MQSGSFQIPYLILIIGPTAVGKTEVALKIAEYFSAPIISADARQFYKELNIGTAKPKDNELESIKHYFINNLSIHDSFSGGQFENESDKLIENLGNKNNFLVMTGGSGMYVDAAVFGLNDLPNKNEAIRARLSGIMREDGIEALQSLLKKLDPEYYEIVDQNNSHRLIRAIEVCELSGKTYTSLRKRKKAKRFFKPIWIGLERDRAELYDRINKRVDMMMDEGLLEEVKELLIYKELNSLQTVGYQELFTYLEDKNSLEEAVELIKRNSRRYAKRQMTWWRNRDYIHWFHPKKIENIMERIEEEMK